jgi:DNA-binding transcriptional regulator LsrR (DeoR family)
MLDAYAKRRKTAAKGESHVGAKLTNKQAAKVRQLYAAGMTQVVLANKFGVSQRAISLVVRNESYVCQD